MKWSEIRQKYPSKFILLADPVEEKISTSKCRIVAGRVLEVSESGKEIRQAYQKYKKRGINVLYSLPTTTQDFIVEDIPFKGIRR